MGWPRSLSGVNECCVAIFFISLLYATIRYIYFGDVALEQVPSYIVNKAAALASVITLALAALGYARQNRADARSWAKASFGFATIHIFLSAALWSREYYPQFFGPRKMNWAGEFTLLFGALAAWLYAAFFFAEKKYFYLLRWLSSALVGLHVLAMGFPKWIMAHDWPGSLPPISLISFILAIGSISLFLCRYESEEP